MSERTFTVYLAPSAGESTVLLDGADISGLLRGFAISSFAGEPQTVTLFPSRGHRVELIARLPEAQIVIERDE